MVTSHIVFIQIRAGFESLRYVTIAEICFKMSLTDYMDHIGIGSPLAEAPSHTTGHAGPHPAIRLIKANHQLSKNNPSDLK